MLKRCLILLPILLAACAEQPQHPMTAQQMYQMQCGSAGIYPGMSHFEDCMMRMAVVDQQRRAAFGNAMMMHMMGY
ncbi:MAG TPA: hypothetical protein VFR08_00870 [Candidatus Angelobacter sp.]|nr:hypothetical protein [Candidatus Angelobacter sp.]